MSYYIHDVPGRLRLKSPLLKRNRGGADEVKKVLSTLQGVATVEINVTTGSILINYNPGVAKKKDIIGALERNGYFDASQAQTNDQYIHTVASKAGNVVGKALLGTFIDKALEGSALSLLSVLL